MGAISHVTDASIMTATQLPNMLGFSGYWFPASALHQPKYCSMTTEASYNQVSLHWYLKSMTHHLEVILLGSIEILDCTITISNYSQP